MGRNYPHAFTKIETSIPNGTLYPAHPTSIMINLRTAQKSLRQIHQEAKAKRQAHFDILISAAAMCKDTKQKQLILNLKRAEELRHCYAMVQSVTKPSQPGGISHIHIPIPSDNPKLQWESIYNPVELENKVLQQHRQHFAQAEGTVFTQEPLCTLINDTCTTDFAQQVLAGTAAIDNLLINKYTKDLLHHLKSKIPSTESPKHPLDKDEVICGFKLWPERMTTSPSGQHLGIYKSMRTCIVNNLCIPCE